MQNTCGARSMTSYNNHHNIGKQVRALEAVARLHPTACSCGSVAQSIFPQTTPTICIPYHIALGRRWPCPTRSFPRLCGKGCTPPWSWIMGGHHMAFHGPGSLLPNTTNSLVLDHGGPPLAFHGPGSGRIPHTLNQHAKPQHPCFA